MTEASVQMKKHTEGVVYLLYLLACALQYCTSTVTLITEGCLPTPRYVYSLKSKLHSNFHDSISQPRSVLHLTTSQVLGISACRSMPSNHSNPDSSLPLVAPNNVRDIALHALTFPVVPVETPPRAGPIFRSAGRRPFQNFRKMGPAAQKFRPVDELASPAPVCMHHCIEV
jgi:hypothetical protein